MKMGISDPYQTSGRSPFQEVVRNGWSEVQGPVLAKVDMAQLVSINPDERSNSVAEVDHL
jgi:hypothetical protein